MSFEALATGSVIAYPYLWAHEAATGEESGRKERPTVVGVRLPRHDGDVLLLFPITTKQPPEGCLSVEIPQTEKQRAGLSSTVRLWIILQEYNTDVIGRSYYLKPAPAMGRFSKAFFLPVMRTFLANRHRVREISRR